MRKMVISFRPCAAIVAAAGLLAGLPAGAPAQTCPNRPIRIVIAFSAGGSIDTLGRIIAQKLSEALGQNVVVENRPGGGANIGAVAASQASPDGHTLHLAAQSLAVNVTLAPAKGFDPVTDFEPIILIATAQDVLLVPFAQDDIVDMAHAVDDVRKVLEIAAEDAPTMKSIAERVIEHAKRGVRDPAVLAERVISEIRDSET
jgi:tripartite-type tricarboxylate transporter receptor subunit TctC